MTRQRSGAARATVHDVLGDHAHPLLATLDSLNANCFIADLGLNLVYMNRKASTTVQTLAPAVKKAFGLDLRDLLHGSIHRFHRDPGRIDRILADPAALPREAEFEFGGIRLATLINAITDGAGTRHGFVVIWEDITARAHEYADIRGQMLSVTALSEGILAATDEDADRASSLAGATEQLRASVGEIARSTATTSQQVSEAVGAVRDAVETMRRLQVAGDEIGGILRLITGVADQTKLLALNATIEAARAGEAGKGFAVVADEVKNLAGTTAASTSDIESRISAIQDNAAAGAAALGLIEDLVSRISEHQATISAAIEEQSSVTQEIASATAGLATSTQEMAGQSRAITAAMEDVVHRTDQLQD